MRLAQEIAHPADHDYVAGSPHLRHSQLRRLVEGSLGVEVARATPPGADCRVLEVGAGHGHFTRILRDAGARVTVTEMSAPIASHLKTVFGEDPAVQVIHDSAGDWIFQTDGQFDLVVAVSVLHHIPDYLKAVRAYADHTSLGGTFMSWQDPLWYPRMPVPVRVVSAAAYAWWRFRQGDVLRGLGRRVRRARGTYDEASISDMAEYHTVRRGVDEVALSALLERRYGEVHLNRYWSAHDGLMQRLGGTAGLANTFALVGRKRLPLVEIDDA